MLDISILSVNVILLIFAKQILRFLQVDQKNVTQFNARVNIFRALNLLIIITLSYERTFSELDVQSIGFKLIAILMVIYMGNLSLHVLNYWIHRRYGRAREINGVKRTIETYRSRMLSILASIFMFVIILIAVINVIGFDSLLEAGGVIGFIGVFLALTQNSWAPDIFSGLIILNSGMFEEGDVIELPKEGCIGVVYKTKIFHTEILNLINNHRIMLRNARLRDQTIHNLSKFASARGLREMLTFQVGYEADPNQVRNMLAEALSTAVEDAEISIETADSAEIGILSTGDHAVEWVIYYYTKDVRNLLKTRQIVREIVLRLSKGYGVELETPMQHIARVSQEMVLEPA